MNSSLLLSMSTFIYAISSLVYIIALVFNKYKISIYGRYLAYLGVICVTFGIILRWYESYKMGIGHIPLSNLYESLIFFAWILTIIYLFIEKKYGGVFIGAFILPIGFLAIAYASLSPNINNTIKPLIPALQSNWLTTHVVTCFLGYGAFTISFVLSIICFLKIKVIWKSDLLKIFPDFYIINQLNYQMIIFGFLFLSVGIITGSVWANSAWGSYWSWDPKETWSLITWFVYAILIHIRLIKSLNDEWISYFSIIGFAAMLFTYFGVNYLEGLHSYFAL